MSDHLSGCFLYKHELRNEIKPEHLACDCAARIKALRDSKALGEQ